MEKIMIASRNKGKIKEFTEFFRPYGIEVTSLVDFETIPDIEETGESFEENAKIKAEQVADIVRMPVLADDSGLTVDALDGAPGIYSARYAGEGSSDDENNEKLLEALRDVPKEKRTARFVCVLAISTPGEETVYYKGYCEGEIGFEAKGENGFGYDPVFIPKGYDRTMAELSSEEKNAISHRSQAFKQLERWEKISSR